MTLAFDLGVEGSTHTYLSELVVDRVGIVEWATVFALPRQLRYREVLFTYALGVWSLKGVGVV